MTESERRIAQSGGVGRGRTRANGVRRWAWTAALLAVVAAIGWADDVTGPEFGFSLLYLVPVALAGHFLGVAPTALAAVSASLAWFFAENAWNGEHRLVAVLWNGATRLAILLSAGLLVARFQALIERHAALARTDPLTGLPNARAFHETMRTWLAASAGRPRPVGLAYLDLDRFKHINDRYGHSVGDEVLCRIARVIGGSVRSEDCPSRLGGDEFAAFLPGIGPEALEIIAWRIVERVREIGAEYPGTGLGASVGWAWFQEPPADTDEILGQADAAMYAAKEAGRGRAYGWRQDEARSARAV